MKASGNLLGLLENLQAKAFRVATILRLGGRDRNKKLQDARLAMNKARALLARFRRLYKLAIVSWFDYCNDELRILPTISLSLSLSTTATSRALAN